MGRTSVQSFAISSKPQHLRRRRKHGRWTLDPREQKRQEVMQLHAMEFQYGCRLKQEFLVDSFWDREGLLGISYLDLARREPWKALQGSVSVSDVQRPWGRKH